MTEDHLIVVASRYRRRGDLGSLDCFVANAPRNDERGDLRKA